MPSTTMNTTTGTTTRIATAGNALGIREFDLVKTVGKGICIALRKKSLNDELVLYSMSSATGRHANDDDGMAKVRRYDSMGKIAPTSESTGRNLTGRDKYTIVGIASYVNPVLAMKDFINQNANVAFDPVVVNERDDDDTANTAPTTPATTADDTVPTADMTEMFAEMIGLLRNMNAKLDEI